MQVNATLDSIRALIEVFEGSALDPLYKRLKSRLNHISARIRRMPIDIDDFDEVTFKNESYATYSILDSDLEEKVENQDSTSNTLSTIFRSSSPQRPSVTVSPVKTSCYL